MKEFRSELIESCLYKVNLVKSYADGQRTIYIAKLVQAAWKQISLRVYDQLLSLELSFHLKGTNASLFSINRAKKGIENNLRYISTYFLPLFVDLTIASVLILKYGGLPALLIYSGTMGFYIYFTRRAARVSHYF